MKIINLKLSELFQLTHDMGFNYIDAKTNKDNLVFDFSTGFNGRGNAIYVVIWLEDNKVNCVLEIYLANDEYKFSNLTFDEMIFKIKKHINNE